MMLEIDPTRAVIHNSPLWKGLNFSLDIRDIQGGVTELLLYYI